MGLIKELLSNNKLRYLILITDIAKHNFIRMGEELCIFKYKKIPFECHKTQALLGKQQMTEDITLNTGSICQIRLKGHMDSRVGKEPYKCLRTLDHLRCIRNKRKQN